LTGLLSLVPSGSKMALPPACLSCTSERHLVATMEMKSREPVYVVLAVFQVLPVGVNVVEDLAVDWVGGHLYWTDYVLETIEVAGLDGHDRTILFTENITNPRGIEIDPTDGYVDRIYVYLPKTIQT
jgi:hypothetical protein